MNIPASIFQIADAQHHRVFNLVGLGKLTPSKSFRLNFKHYIELERDVLQDRFTNYMSNPMGYSPSQGQSQNVSIELETPKKLAEVFSKRLEKMNNRIEFQ